MNPKISVIIPVYNVERYLEVCVKSVEEQTFQEFEIILVDDGSTDESGRICDALKERDSRIHVIHKNNSGPSETRNIGVEKSRGDYITFIDSDDTINVDYLSVLFSLIEQFQADVSSCEFLFCEEGESPNYKKTDYEIGMLTGKEALMQVLQGTIHSTSACGLLINRNLVKKIKFPLGKYHEDDLTTYKYFMHARAVAYTKQPLYTYYQRKGSIMHKPFSQIDIDELDAGDHIYEECSKLGRGFKEAALSKKTENYCQVLFKFPDLKKKNPGIHRRVNTFINTEMAHIMMNKYIGRRRKVNILLYKMRLLNLVEK